MSTSVEVNFLSNNFVSRQNFANFAPSIRGAASLAPKEQKLLKIVSKLLIFKVFA